MSTRFQIVSAPGRQIANKLIGRPFNVIDTNFENVVVAENMSWNTATILAEVMEVNHRAAVEAAEKAKNFDQSRWTLVDGNWTYDF
jgi:hypothetical protein